MSRREQALVTARLAGYHGDQRAFIRALVETRVSRKSMDEAWATGLRQRKAGVPCGCASCSPKVPA